MRVLGPTALLVPITLLAACGASGSTQSAQVATAPTQAPGAASSAGATTDQSAIEQVVNTAETSSDLATTCGQLLTADLLKTMFVTLKNCKNSSLLFGDHATSASVTGIAVSGTSATGKVTAHGGAPDGVSGSWQFTQDAGKWRISGFGTDFLRAQFNEEFDTNYPSGDPAGDPFASGPYRACIAAAAGGLADQAFRAVFTGYDSLRNSEFGTLAAACDKAAPDGKSPFRVMFDTAFTTAEDGMTKTENACVVQKFASLVTDAELVNETLNGNTGPKSKIVEATGTATAACLKGGGSAKAVRIPQVVVAPRGRPISPPTETDAPTSAPDTSTPSPAAAGTSAPSPTMGAPSAPTPAPSN